MLNILKNISNCLLLPGGDPPPFAYGSFIVREYKFCNYYQGETPWTPLFAYGSFMVKEYKFYNYYQGETPWTPPSPAALFILENTINELLFVTINYYIYYVTIQLTVYCLRYRLGGINPESCDCIFLQPIA